MSTQALRSSRRRPRTHISHSAERDQAERQQRRPHGGGNLLDQVEHRCDARRVPLGGALRVSARRSADPAGVTARRRQRCRSRPRRTAAALAAAATGAGLASRAAGGRRRCGPSRAGAVAPEASRPAARRPWSPGPGCRCPAPGACADPAVHVRACDALRARARPSAPPLSPASTPSEAPFCGSTPQRDAGLADVVGGDAARRARPSAAWAAGRSRGRASKARHGDSCERFE